MRIHKLNSKAKIAIGIILLVCCIYAINIHRDRNYRAFRNEVLVMDKSVNTVELNSLTPFEWDKVYFFAPYVGGDMIYEVIGYRFGRVSPPQTNQNMQLVFIKNEKVVCYDHGNHSSDNYSIWYGFDYHSGQPQYAVLNSKDNPIFAVSHDRRFTFITYPVDYKRLEPQERDENDSPIPF